MSNLLQRFTVSREKFEIGRFASDEPEEKYIPESEYKRMLERCQAEKEDSYRAGYTDGHTMGLGKGMEEAQRVATGFHQLILDVQNQKADIFKKAELDVIDLSLAIARKIIGAKAETDDEIVLDAARKAVRLLLDRASITVKIAPEQEAFVRDNLERFYAIDDRVQRIQVESDRRIKPGGCILETDSGSVDSRIETELQNITKSLLKTNINQSGQ